MNEKTFFIDLPSLGMKHTIYFNEWNTLKIVITFGVFLLSLTGCVNTIFVQKEYRDSDLSTKTLQIRVVDDTFGLDYKGDLTNEFGKVSINDSVKSFFISSLLENFKKETRFNSVTLKCGIDQLSSGNFFCQNKKDNVQYDSITFYFPNGLSEDSTEMTLVLQNIFIRSFNQINMISTGFIPVVYTSKPLIIESELLYWDNKSKKPIAWGIIKCNTTDGLYVDINTWKNALKNFTRATLTTPPLVKTLDLKSYYGIKDTILPEPKKPDTDSKSFRIRPISKSTDP